VRCTSLVYFGAFENISGRAASSILPKLPNLSFLDLSECKKVGYLVEGRNRLPKKLIYLNLSNTNIMPRYLGRRNNRRLEALILRQDLDYELGNGDVKQLATEEDKKRLLRLLNDYLSQVKVLDLSHVHCVDGDVIESIKEKCAKLERLIIGEKLFSLFSFFNFSFSFSR